MNNLRYPYLRAEVVSALESLSDREYQQRVWVEHILPAPGQGDNFTMVFNSLFEDVPVVEDPMSFIGTVLRNQAEAHAMTPLKRAVDRLHEAMGYNRTDAEYLASPLWDDVVATASHALAELRRTVPGEPAPDAH